MVFQPNDKVLTITDQVIGYNGGEWHIPEDEEGVVISHDDAALIVHFTVGGESVDLPVMSTRVKVSDKAARNANLAEMIGDKVVAALTQITNDETARDTDETAVDADIASVSTATNTQLRDMVGRMLAREKKALNREARSLNRQRAIIRKLSRLGANR